MGRECQPDTWRDHEEGLIEFYVKAVEIPRQLFLPGHHRFTLVYQRTNKMNYK